MLCSSIVFIKFRLSSSNFVKLRIRLKLSQLFFRNQVEVRVQGFCSSSLRSSLAEKIEFELAALKEKFKKNIKPFLYYVCFKP